LGRQDSNFCISKSDLLNFIVAQWDLGRRSDVRDFIKECPAIRDAQVRVLPPRLRVMVNFDFRLGGDIAARPRPVLNDE
jgi:hypothetical protein